MESVASNILKVVKRKGRGYVFTPDALRSHGTRAAVDQALSRLARSGEIRRLGRGIYDYPKISQKLGPLTPAPEAVAEALARQEGAHLQTSGARAANALGLTTQVPGRLTFLTDGTPRSRRVGNQTIELRRAAPRKLRGAATVAGTVLQAIRYLGRERVTDDVVHHLAHILSPRDKRELRSLAATAPGWARPFVYRIADSEDVAIASGPSGAPGRGPA
jgi:predicted transcriptional regulator of viral defense system